MTLLANMIELVAECCVLGFLGISCVTFGAGAQLISMCKYHVSLLRAPPQGSSPWRPCSWPTPASSTWASTLSASAATRRRGRRWWSQQGRASSGGWHGTSPSPPTPTQALQPTARVELLSSRGCAQMTSTVLGSLTSWPPLNSNLLQSVRPSKVRSDTIRLNLKMANWGLQRHLLTAPYKCLTYNRSMYCQCNVRTSTMKLLSKINHSVNEQKQKLCAPFDEFTWILIWIAVLCICMENCLG